MATHHINVAKVLGKRGYTAEANRVGKAAQARQEADSAKLLSPTDVSGEYDAARLLMTTLGGQLRQLTHDDLRHFAALAKKLGKKFKGGITAKGVIDQSLPIDRARANEQIRTAVVVKAQGGVLHFVTNAGPASDAVRHHVYVEFPTFKAIAAQGQKADKLARGMLDGPLRLSCDCGRARFWLDFVQTIGGFKYGPPQNSFPKIRNPRLVGVGCKHVLRVMQAVLKDAMVKAKAVQMIAAAQSNDTKAKTVTAAEAKAAAQRQIDQSHHVKNKVETTKETLTRRAAVPGALAKAKSRALALAAKAAQKRMQADVAKSKRSMEAAFAKLAAAPMTKAMRDALIKRLMQAQTTD